MPDCLHIYMPVCSPLCHCLWSEVPSLYVWVMEIKSGLPETPKPQLVTQNCINKFSKENVFKCLVFHIILFFKTLEHKECHLWQPLISEFLFHPFCPDILNFLCWMFTIDLHTLALFFVCCLLCTFILPLLSPLIFSKANRGQNIKFNFVITSLHYYPVSTYTFYPKVRGWLDLQAYLRSHAREGKRSKEEEITNGSISPL